MSNIEDKFPWLNDLEGLTPDQQLDYIMHHTRRYGNFDAVHDPRLVAWLEKHCELVNERGRLPK